jgi:DNA-binding GntR family transcriptional regulator
MVIENNIKTNGLKRIQDLTLREKVYSQIKDLILTNKFYPGQVLVIDHIASELGLSHTPVREALAMLELDGLVSTSQHRNPRVADITPSDIEELYEMRILLEPWAIKHSSLMISIEEIKGIENDLHTAYNDAKNHDFDAHLRSDIRLHHLILSSTGNQFFWQLAGRVHDQSIRIRSLVEATGSEQDVFSIIREHFEITESIKIRDSYMAYEKLLTHLKTGRERTLLALKRIPNESGFLIG